MEVMPAFPSPQIQFNRIPLSTPVSTDDESKVISDESSATEGKSIASAIVSNATPLSPSKIICHFSCKACHDLAKEPVINVICGHLFCWSCLCGRLTPPDPEGRGFLRGCPFCKSHLDISPTMSTVIPVYSGPEPGIEYSRDHNPEPVPDEEEERKREEAVRKEGKVYVAPRPAWRTRSRYTSKIELVVDMLFTVGTARAEGKRYLKWLEGASPHIDNILCHQHVMDRLIQEVKDGWLWLTGNEYPKQPEKINEEGHHIIFIPTYVKLPHISTFTCRICEETAFEPVVTICGHLFCWTCLWNKISGVSRCPKCNMSVNLLASRANISSVYCEPNDPCKEDKSLKSSRKGFRQEIQAPCRPAEMLPVSFMDRMIKNIDEGRNMIVNLLNNLKSNCADLGTEQIDEASSKVNKMWDVLYADLVNEWRKSTREQVEESKIKPTLLDFISERRVKSNDEYGTVFQYWGYVSDYIGDTMIN